MKSTKNGTASSLGKRHSHKGTLCAAAIALLALFTIPVAPASAAPPDFLWQEPEHAATGSGAGQLNNPWGIAADPADPGRIYVADLGNKRITVLSAWGSFVEAWGWNVAPDGAPGDTAADAFEICTASCQAGSSGSNVGQFFDPMGVAVDGVGAVYVYDPVLYRVQKFASDGEFLLMFGAEVNKTMVAKREEQEANAEPVTVTEQEENLCTKADLEGGDECGAGVPDVGPGDLSNDTPSTYLTYNPVSDSIFIGDVDRILEFGTDGTLKAEIPMPVSGDNPTNRRAGALAADPLSGDLYFAFAHKVFQKTPNVIRLSRTTGKVLGQLTVGVPRVITVDVEGTVYVAWEPPDAGTDPEEVIAFDSGGAPMGGMEALDRFGIGGKFIAIHGLATNFCAGSDAPGNLYASYFYSGGVSSLKAFGTGPVGCEPPPLAPPAIEDQYAVSVGTDAATLRAEINPRFWTDTTYYMQYGAEPCSEGGCTSQPAAPGTVLTKKSANTTIPTSSVLLAGLEPDTTYHYRFVAQSSGSEGEEVIGVGGKPGEPGGEASFTTFPLPDALVDDCSNQGFRAGAGARLPDCRAYEMVSPLEKNSGDIAGTEAGPVPDSVPATYNQAAIDGRRLTFSSVSPFGGAESSPFVSQFLSARQPLGSPDEGWSTEPISPPRTRTVPGVTASVIDTEFRAFSPDLCTAWLRTLYDPPLGPGAVAGFPNIYRRDNCGEGGYLGLTPVAPDSLSSEEKIAGYIRDLHLQGVSADGATALYAASDDFAGSGAPSNVTLRPQLYEHANGLLRFACILPNGNPTTKGCTAGTGDFSYHGRASNLQNALSEDGERYFWTELSAISGLSGTTHPFGKIFLGRKGEPAIPVSQTISNGDARFWGATPEGSRAIFEIGGFLYSFDAEAAIEGAANPSTLIAKDAVGVFGLSQDASHVYFASTDELGGENGADEVAEIGEPNLYLWREGEGIEFIVTLDALDTSGRLSPINSNPVFRTSRVSPDGLHVAFTSRAPLTGYDNTDALSGEPDTEVFRYAAESGELACVSCNPTGARPIGRERDFSGGVPTIWIAAEIPSWESPFHAPRALSDDGSRLFFESYEALVPTDTNGVQDVYQWEIAGMGSCDEGDANFDEGSGGCVELISTGESPHESTFVDASPGGDDVFFTTISSLYGPDYGLVDIYDARVEGGFPAPSSTPGCEGEACQGPLVAPNDPTPASSSFEGAGNVNEAPRPVKCAKGRKAVRKAGRTRCVKKPRKTKRAKRANKTRRAAR